MRPVEYFGLAAAFFTLSLALSAIKDSFDSPVAQTCITGLAIIAILAGIILLFLAPPCKKRMGKARIAIIGNLKDQLADSRRGFNTIRRKIALVISVCGRCLGYYIGVLASAILVLSINNNVNIDNLRASIPAPVHFAMAFLLILPSALHGAFRRWKGPSATSATWVLVLTGFMAGLAWIFSYLGFKSILNG